MEDITVSLPEEYLKEIEGELSYGDSRSAWVREAVRQRLAREGLLEEESETSGNRKAEA